MSGIIIIFTTLFSLYSTNNSTNHKVAIPQLHTPQYTNQDTHPGACAIQANPWTLDTNAHDGTCHLISGTPTNHTSDATYKAVTERTAYSVVESISQNKGKNTSVVYTIRRNSYG